MYISVRDTPLAPPIFSSNQASWAEIRDEDGFLVLLLLFPPGKATVMVIDRKDPDFETTIRNFSIKLQQKPEGNPNDQTLDGKG